PLSAEAAVRAGRRPFRAGRSAERLRPPAERLDVPWQAVDGTDEAALAGLIRGTPLILLAASPLDRISATLVQACLAAGTHYLDVANETGVFEAVYALDQASRRAGVTLLPGVGFGVVACDPLARYTADPLPDAHALALPVSPSPAATGRGRRANARRVLAGGGLVRRGGRPTPVRLGAGARRAAAPTGERTLMPVPTGELSAAYRTTGIPDITVWMPIGLPSGLVKLAGSALGILARSRTIQQRAASRPRTPLPAADPDRRTYVFARAGAADGRGVTVGLQTGEGYAFTAESAVRAVEAVLANPVPGAHSPGALLGADFALGVPGTRRIDAAMAVT